MKRFNNINEFNCRKSTIITIGTFDGVHLGHQKILKKLNIEAENNGLESSVLTFFPHPRTVLNPGSSLKLINTIEERISLFKKSKIDNLIIHPFTKEFSELDSEDYVKNILVDQLKAKIVLIGYDHKFGKNRTADINNLKEYGIKYNFEVIEIKAEEINDIAISSTKIRNSIEEGDIQLTNSYLGYEFSFFGKVVKGNSIGKTLGFPTANIKIGTDLKLIPKNGVYLISTIMNQKIGEKQYERGNTSYYLNTNYGLAVKIDCDIHIFDLFQIAEMFYFSILQSNLLYCLEVGASS